MPRRRIPIAVVMTSFEPGGTERQMIELIRRLDPDRWAVHLACFRRQRRLVRARVRRRRVGRRVSGPKLHAARTRSRHLWAFARWCRAHRIAVVQTSELYSNIFGLPGARARRRAGAHRQPPRDQPGQDRSRRSRCSAPPTPARTWSSPTRARRPTSSLKERVPERKIAVMPNGLDLGLFRAAVGQPPAAQGGRRREPAAGKGPRRADRRGGERAAAASRTRRFEFVGGGPRARTLRARCAALGMCSTPSRSSAICDDVPARLAAADIFVLPSRSEAFPNARPRSDGRRPAGRRVRASAASAS